MTYQMTVAAQKTMMGKRTGAIVARLESDYSGNVISAEGKSISEAKQALMNALGAIAGNPERAYVFCGDLKTVLVVSFAGGSWEYAIIDAERNSPCGCIMPTVTSFKEAKERAWDHASQSFGGVLNTL